MSEYQYYEFRALDRRLTPEEMAALRKLSTRATITPTSFINEYNYGNFRGDPRELVQRYFDAYLYMANWGTRELMFRLPAELLTRLRREGNVPGMLPPGLVEGKRSIADLCAAADRRAEARERAEAERKAKEQARRDRERAVKRRAYLDDLAGRQVEVWRQVEWLIDARRPAEYDQAVQLLRDLRDVAVRDTALPEFEARLGQLRAMHAKKTSFISRLDSAALR